MALSSALYICALSILATITLPLGQTAPVVTTHPTSATVPLNSNITFTCAGYRYIVWEINDTQLLSDLAERFFNRRGIFGALDDQNSSQLFVLASLENNGTEISCILREDPGFIDNEESEIAYLYVYGSPNPPSNLTVTQSGLSWEAPFSLEGENITYIVTAINTETGASTERRTTQTHLLFDDLLQDHDCSVYDFSVYSENPFGQSHESANITHTMPTRPASFVIIVEVSHMNGLTVTLQFDDPSPCDSYRVTSYNLIFEDQIESSDSFTKTMISPSDAEDEVLLIVDYQDTDLQMGRHYLASVEAVNQVGSTMSEPVVIYTTGLQSSSIELEEESYTASVTCNFALGSDALGCEVSFYASTSMEPLFAQNITREPTSNSVTDVIILTEELQAGGVLVQVAELQADGSVHSIVIHSQEFQNTPLSKFATTSSLKETQPTEKESTTVLPPDLIVDSFSPKGVLGTTHLVGAILGSVVVLLVLSVVIGVLVVMSISNKRRVKVFISGEDPKVDLEGNMAYGVVDKQRHQKGCHSKSTRITRATTPQEILQASDLFGAECPMGVKKPAPYEVCVPSTGGRPVANSTGTLSNVVANPVYADVKASLSQSDQTEPEEVKPHTYEEIKPKTVHSSTEAAQGGPVIYDEVKHDPDGIKLKGNKCYGVTNSTINRSS